MTAPPPLSVGEICDTLQRTVDALGANTHMIQALDKENSRLQAKLDKLVGACAPFASTHQHDPGCPTVTMSSAWVGGCDIKPCSCTHGRLRAALTEAREVTRG